MWQKTGIGEGDSIIILIGFKIIILLFAVNATPPVIAFLLEDRWNRLIDWNRTFFDGKPLLGCHKTIRGIIGSIAAGILLGWFLGLPIIVGFCIGSFSMLGDLLTSFFKRRFELASGAAVPLLDQLFEGLFPLLFVKYFFLSDWVLIVVLLILFVPITYFGALFFKKKILPAPHEKNLRLVKSRTRFRAWRACHIALPPFAMLS